MIKFRDELERVCGEASQSLPDDLEDRFQTQRLFRVQFDFCFLLYRVNDFNDL